MSRRTIKTLAKEIKARWPHLCVIVDRGYCDTDRKIGRLRIPGKGRWGSRITVHDSDGMLLLNHNNAETYRTTQDVQDWIDEYHAHFSEKVNDA